MNNDAELGEPRGAGGCCRRRAKDVQAAFRRRRPGPAGGRWRRWGTRRPAEC